MSKEEILRAMLATVPDTHDKRPGSFIWDALDPVAERLAETDKEIQSATDKMVIDHLSGDELAQRVRERTGIERRAATYAKGVVTLTGTGTIRIGDIFETEEGIQFRSTETKPITSSGTVNIQAVVSGASGNVPADTITLFPVTLAGFTAVTNPQPTQDGFDAESDEDLLTRYYAHIRTPATSGNKHQYRNWALEVQGVGDAKVIPLWAGDNTVKLILIDAERQPASQEVVDSVQAYIDPNGNGDGSGVSPIGGILTTVSATGVEIDVEFTAAVTEEQKEDIQAALINYLKSIAFKQGFVSYAVIGSTILTVIDDYADLTLNGSQSNITIDEDEVAVLGEVLINE